MTPELLTEILTRATAELVDKLDVLTWYTDTRKQAFDDAYTAVTQALSEHASGISHELRMALINEHDAASREKRWAYDRANLRIHDLIATYRLPDESLTIDGLLRFISDAMPDAVLTERAA